MYNASTKKIFVAMNDTVRLSFSRWGPDRATDRFIGKREKARREKAHRLARAIRVQKGLNGEQWWASLS